MSGDAAERLIRATFGGTRYLGRMLEVLDTAQVRVSAAQSTLVVFEAVAGAAGVTKVHVVLGERPEELLSPLYDARLIVCEVPDDEPWAQVAASLLAAGFREESRVAHFVADGVALRLLVRRG
ncbi:MAG TPA: hypothetical protein VF929_09535 [Gemmatimonadaceae bacterium]